MAPHRSVELKSYIIAKIEQGVLTPETASYPGASTKSIGRWMKDKQQLGAPRPPGARSGRPPTLTATAQAIVKTLVVQRPWITRPEIRRLLKDTLALDVSTTTIYRFIASAGLGDRINTEYDKVQDAAARADWLQMLHTKNYLVSQLISAGESRIGENLRLLCALTADGHAMQVFDEDCTSQRFEHWVEQLLLPFMTPFPGPRSVLVVSDTAVHRSQRMQDLIEKRGE